MPYMQRRFVQRPFQPYVPYIQRGGGIFSTIADVAKRYVMPFFTRAAKMTGESFMDAAQSAPIQNVIDHAKKAVTEGIKDASGRILQGENVGQALKTVTNQTKSSIANKLKDEAARVGTALRQKRDASLSSNKSTPAKKPKVTPNRGKKKKKKAYLPKKFRSVNPATSLV